MKAGQMCSWSTKCRMSRLWKRWVATKKPYRNDAFPMLGNTKICCIDFLNMNPITRFNYRFQ